MTNSPKITIRPAGPGDWETVVDFNCRLAEESEGKRLDRGHVEPGVKALLADARKGRYYLALIDGEIVGQLMHTYEWSDWRNGDIWWLQSVYVIPDRRRQGVFRALFEHLRTAAQDDPGVVGLRLYVEEQNAHAHATYANLGFQPGGYFVLEQSHRRGVKKVNEES
ncbi:MAG: GNAT family N-acetyltransferase [Planctomycetota bacterium]|nr:GNAT family N-acetyltransferase [Planctomycetota bacterium]